jgi:hypothetical protein
MIMNTKRKLIWLLVLMVLLTACGGSRNGSGLTATSASPGTAVSQPTPADTATEPVVINPTRAAEVAESNEPEPTGEPGPDMDAEIETELEPAVALSDLEGLEDDQKAIQLLASETAVAEFLVNYPDWSADSWPEDEENGIWGIDFYSEAADEWLGWGQVNIQTGEILDYFVPRDLSPEEFQAGLAEVEKLVLNDAGVQARLGDPELWEHETYFNRWDQIWEVWFWHGLDELVVTVNRDEENTYLEEIFDPSQLEAEKEAEWQRDQAVELAWSAEGIDQAFDGVDNWHTLVAPQGDLWAVSFVSDEQELFYALVDINRWEIVDAK